MNQYITILKAAVNNLLDIFFPKPAQVHRLEHMSVAEAFLEFPAAIESVRNTHCLFAYRHPLIKTLIWQLEYKGNPSIVRLCGEILYVYILKMLPHVDNPLLIPIPISHLRRRERGFNQIELLINACMSFDAQKHLEHDVTSLIKVRHTTPQSSTKSRADRLNNLSGCFAVTDKEKILGRNIILIDDVVTTGSTFTEAKKTLLTAGAQQVYCVALAH